MSIFKKVKTAKTEEVADRVGGGFIVHDTAVYPAKLIRAYGITSDRGSLGVVLEMNLFKDPNDDTKATRYNETLYVTDQNQNNFYTSTKDGKNYMNTGWLLVDALALFATDGEAGLAELDTEEIFIKRTKDGKEVNVKAEAYPEMTDLEFNVAMLKVSKPKQVQVDGKWQDTEDMIEVNEITKVFDAEGFTILEWQAEQAEPVFIDKWEKQWAGKVKTLKAKITETKRTGGSGRSSAGGSSRPAGRTSARPSRFTK